MQNKQDDITLLQNGEGKVVKINNEQVAVCKDHEGHMHSVSAICTHLGCTVGWNANDQTWDCPCHGSRFDKDGKVINGPATQDLPKKDI